LLPGKSPPSKEEAAMASVVFLRGVNVGGHRKFQPSVLARELAEFDVVNVGAAGTLVVRRAVPAAMLHGLVLGRLPFEAELMICRGRDILELLRRDPFAGQIPPQARPFLTVLAKRPRKLPPLPHCQPAGDRWEVKVLDVTGRFALSLWRKMGRILLYPNEVVEKTLGIAATTRSWNTILTIRDLLAEPLE
jgi:uncharacterized protein (DUF1697 family)